MANSKPNIIISLPLVWSIRNFILSGICDQLSKKYNLYYVFEVNNKITIDYYISDEKSKIVLDKFQNIDWLFIILKKVFSLKFPQLDYINDIMEKGGIGDKRFTGSNLMKDILFNKIAQIVYHFKLFFILEQIWFFLCSKKQRDNVKKTILEINPQFILSTTVVVSFEWNLIVLAKRNKIPIYTHILSFDNITSRGYIPISNINKFFVWNGYMKSELIKYYNISSELIHITGTPQFDFHKQVEFYLNLNDVQSSIGLESNQKYIVYCSNHYFHTPNEPELVEDIICSLSVDSKLKDYRLVLRLHPLDDYARWDELIKNNLGKVILSIPWKHPNKDNTSIGLVSKGDLITFVNLLKYASVILNIASTITIDAAMVNTPSICIGFHSNNKLESKCYYDYHFSEHFKKIIEFESSPIVLNMESLIEHILSSVEFPELLENSRKKLADFYFPIQNGSSSFELLNLL